jgi:hypothetical protein
VRRCLCLALLIAACRPGPAGLRAAPSGQAALVVLAGYGQEQLSLFALGRDGRALSPPLRIRAAERMTFTLAGAELIVGVPGALERYPIPFTEAPPSHLAIGDYRTAGYPLAMGRWLLVPERERLSVVDLEGREPARTLLEGQDPDSFARLFARGDGTVVVVYGVHEKLVAYTAWVLTPGAGGPTVARTFRIPTRYTQDMTPVAVDGEVLYATVLTHDEQRQPHRAQHLLAFSLTGAGGELAPTASCVETPDQLLAGASFSLMGAAAAAGGEVYVTAEHRGLFVFPPDLCASGKTAGTLLSLGGTPGDSASDLLATPDGVFIARGNRVLRVSAKDGALGLSPFAEIPPEALGFGLRFVR